MSLVEIWRPVHLPEFSELYSVSNLGRIRSEVSRSGCTVGTIKKNSVHQQTGYLTTMLSCKQHDLRTYVHRLVCKAFHENPENKPRVNHKNFVRSDNRAENLEWCTAKENTQHAMASPHFLARKPRGEACACAKLSAESVLEIRSMSPGMRFVDIAKIFGVSPETVRGIVKRRSWKHI